MPGAICGMAVNSGLQSISSLDYLVNESLNVRFYFLVAANRSSYA